MLHRKLNKLINQNKNSWPFSLINILTNNFLPLKVVLFKKGLSMPRKIIISLTIILFFTGCASSSDLEKKANLHAKSGNYYESIGQPGAAREEYNETKEKRNRANKVMPILVELFNLFSEKGH